MPETPVFLYKQGKVEAGNRVLRNIYKPEFLEAKKQAVFNEVENVKLESQDPFFTSLKNLFQMYTRCVVVGVGL